MPVLTTGAAAGFYEATAQILPIFLLVMLVGDARLGTTGPRHPSRLWFSLLIYVLNAAIILAGEVAALIAVGSGETNGLHLLTCGALAASAGYLMMRFLVTTLNDYSEHFSREARRRQLRAVLALSVPIIVFTYFTLIFATN